MKSNRQTFYVCMAIAALCTFAYILTAQELTINVFLNLFMGIITGAIISLVVALIGYFRERENLVSKATEISMGTYMDLVVLKELIGYALTSIGHTVRMQDIPFKDISSTARRLFENYSDVSGKLYIPFIRKGNLARSYYNFASYRSVFQNIALIAQSIESIALKIEIDSMQTFQVPNVTNQPISPSPLSSERNKLLLVRVSKFHEHVTDRTMQYEAIAQYFINRAYGKDAWENARKEIDSELGKIMSNYTTNVSYIP